MMKRFRQYLRVWHAFFLNALTFIRPPKVKFVIFAQGRTGSTLLVDLINSVEDTHCDREILNIFFFTGQRISRPVEYVLGRAKRFRNKIYGFKVKVYQLENDHKIADPRKFLLQLQQNGFKIIYLRRLNALEHSFSALSRKKTGVTHLREGKRELGPIEVQVDKLIYDINRKIKYTNHELDILQGISRLDLTYEDDLRDSAKHLETVNRIRKFIGVEPVQSVKTTYTKINSRPLREKISNFDQVEAALKAEGLNHLLNES
jgi:hypothetical protein